MSDRPNQPESLPPSTPDELERALSALSTWEGALPEPRPFERALVKAEEIERHESARWKIFTKPLRPQMWVASAAAVLMMVVLFAGAIPSLRTRSDSLASARLKTVKDIDGDGGTQLAVGDFAGSQQQQLQKQLELGQARQQSITSNSGFGVQDQQPGGERGMSPAITGGMVDRADAERDQKTVGEKRDEYKLATPAPATPAAASAGPPVTTSPADAKLPSPSAAPATKTTTGSDGASNEPSLKDAAPAKPALPSSGDPGMADKSKHAEPTRPAADADVDKKSADLNKDLGFAAKRLQEQARSVITRAAVEVLVPDVRAAVEKLTPLVEIKLGEYVEQQALSGDDRKPQSQSATIVLRCAVERVPEVLIGVRSLGRVTSDTQSGEDATDRIIDLGARLRTEEKLEAELLKLIEDRNKENKDKLEEVMKARESLKHVRQTIEQLSAQNEALRRSVRLATIAVSVRHEVEAPPVPPPSIPTTKDKLNEAASRGASTFTDTLASAVQWVIGGALWWAVMAAIALAAWFVIRRMNRTSAGEPPPQ